MKNMKMKFFGGFFALLLMLSSLFGIIPGVTENVYALPTEPPTAEQLNRSATGATGSGQNGAQTSGQNGSQAFGQNGAATGEAQTTEENGEQAAGSDSSCKDSLGSLGWLVCPTTGKISEAVDFLYDKIGDVLEINPVEAKDGSPVYEIWKYFQGVTNVLFCVFLLIVVFSQVTGVGITNYGIKKALPKLIIAAILVNLSFYICSLAVDVSNIFGEGIRGLFESIESSTTGSIETATTAAAAGSGDSAILFHDMYTSVASGVGLAVTGGVIAFETGAIWMLIPLAFGALVSVVIGLITIAMRQAVVTLLIMIAPLAMVAYILPNTEQWFKKWKELLTQMIVFYPAFSLLFGASSVAGWAIIVSSQNGFGVMMGVAVQIFPLFFSWKLMKMSGTFLGTISNKLSGLASGAVGGVRDWAGSHRDLTRAKHLAAKNAYTPSLKLQQFLENRKIAREEETKEHLETVKNRGLAYAAMRNYKRGTEIPSKEGEEAYEAQARNLGYQKVVERHKDNMNRGLGQLEEVKQNGTLALKARLNELDAANVNASDSLKMEQARGEMIDYENAVGYHKRMQDALNSHFDDEKGWMTDADGNKVVNPKYKRHFDLDSVKEAEARARYSSLSKTMEGNKLWSQYAEASAAQAYDTQAKIIKTKMQTSMDLTPPTQDVVYRLDEWTKSGVAAKNMDAIVSALRVVNARGDTDLVKEQIDNILDKSLGGGLQLGTHGSQALASFLMFDVKDSDPMLRRFGKYINLETARAYNENERKVLDFSYDEYVKGYHDGETDLVSNDNPTGRMYAKKDMVKLLEGTSLDNIERTTFSSLDESLKKAYGFDKDNPGASWDVSGWLKKREEIQTAFEPAFLSASLKWLSGSEQINSGVKFWTGYELKQQKRADGTLMLDENGDPVYGLTPAWNSKEFAGHESEVERYFRRKTNDYFKDQTTGQILGMRTDYRDATMEHLVETYLRGLEPEDEMDENERSKYEERQAEYDKKKAEIQTRYGDLDIEEANRLRKRDMKALKMEIAGKQVRKILGETGKLEQIYRTKRSGAANNAKDWLRRWVNLDDEEAMAKEVKYYENLRKSQRHDEQQVGEADSVNPDSARIYNAGTRKSFRDQLDKEFKENEDMSVEEFYDYCLKLIHGWFGNTPSVIEHDFKEYYNTQVKGKDYRDAHDLKQTLEDLLQDPDKYPDA